MATAHPKARLTAGSSCLGMLAVGANGTAIMAAIPTIRCDIGLDAGELEWAINAYLIASAACIVLGGKTADRAGARGVAVFGLALFAAASATIAMAGSPVWLLAGRALQGLGAAFAVPGTLAAVSTASLPERRASAIGAWAGFLMLGFSIGPLLGGALTHYLGWRSVFWCIALVLLLAVGGLLGTRPADVERRSALRGAFDFAGFLSLAVFMLSATFALQGLPKALSAPFAFAAALVAAGAALALFVHAERRAPEPFVDLVAFESSEFLRALVVSSIAMFCILPLLLYFNLDAQSAPGLSLSAVGAGLSLLPMSAGLLVFALLAPRLVLRFGPRNVITCGMLAIVIASAAVAVAAADRAHIPLSIGLFGLGAGLALPYATAPRLALAALPPGQAGQGAGVVNASTFLGGSIGVTSGAIAYALGGLSAVMALLAAAALAGAAISRRIA
jgi:MFS family permease